MKCYMPRLQNSMLKWVIFFLYLQIMYLQKWTHSIKTSYTQKYSKYKLLSVLYFADARIIFSTDKEHMWNLSILAVQSNILEQSQWYICMKQDTWQTPAGCCIRWRLSVWDSWWRCLYKDMDWLRKRGNKLGCLLNNNDTLL